MASKITVKSCEFDKFIWSENNGTYTLENNPKFRMTYTDGSDTLETAIFSFKKGFKCDGLSVPKIFQWFIPAWDWNNMLFNLAGVVHDGLYGNKGFGVFNRDDADAIFRGILREAGLNRFHASTADFMLGLFACTHWGDDSYNCKDLVKMNIK